jgi:hypothetical protein
LEAIIASKGEVKDEGDKLKFMKHMAESLPFVDDYKELYTFTVLLLVALIDPSAIVLTIAATFLLGNALRERKEQKASIVSKLETEKFDKMVEEVDQIFEEVVPDSDTEEIVEEEVETEEIIVPDEEVVQPEPEVEIDEVVEDISPVVTESKPRKLVIPASVESTISTEGQQRPTVQRNADATSQFTTN